MNEQKKLPEVNIVPDIGGLAWLADELSRFGVEVRAATEAQKASWVCRIPQNDKIKPLGAPD